MIHPMTNPSSEKIGSGTEYQYNVCPPYCHEYHFFKSSKRSTAAESLAFLTLGIGSPMHSSVHPLSVVFTLTAKVNLFACAGPPSFTHLKISIHQISYLRYCQTTRGRKCTDCNFLPIGGHRPISTQADIIQCLSGKCLVAILLFPILLSVLLSFSCFLLLQNSKGIPGS